MSKLNATLAVCLLIFGMVMAPFPGVIGGLEAASTNDDSSSNKGKNFENGQKAFEQADWQIAIDHFKKAVAEDAKNADAYNLMGYSYRRLGKADPAFEAYAIALELNPKHRGANEYLGQTYLLIGDLEKAEAQLKILKGLCGNQCQETVKLRKAIERYNASADKEASLNLNEESW